MSEYTRIRSCGCSAASSASDSGSSSRDVHEREREREHDRDRDRDSCACCKASLRDALRLLCSNTISDLVDFDAFAFITDDNAAGAQPQAMDSNDNDNLGDLEGTFRRFSAGNCDLIDISAQVYTPFGPTIVAEEASLCALTAIVFELLPGEDSSVFSGAGDDCDRDRDRDRDRGCRCCCNDTTLRRYRRVRDLLQNELENTGRNCGECTCDCDCEDDCCCAGGVLAALSNSALNKRTTLTAGQLSVRDVTALGTLGSVLVLGDEDQARFYFVCAQKVEFLA